VHLRAILGNIGVIVLPEQLAVSKANEAFDEDGSLRDESQQKKVADIARKVVETVAKLKA
jgi:chromate reductase, NAD(P)H dehydrogenase (quinone)